MSLSNIPYARSLLVLSVVFWGLSAGAAEPMGESAALKAKAEQRYKNIELLQKVIQYVEAHYVEPVDHDVLMQGAIRGVLETLDPHSNFLSREVFREMKADTAGKFAGVGLETTVRDGSMVVVTPIEDSPAWKAGLLPNDVIIKINGESVKGMSLTDASSRMRGKKGSKVVVSILRSGFEKPRDYALEREIIRVRAVKSQLLEPGYGYARLTTFSESVGADLKKSIQSMGGNELKGLVLDLRFNPGGLLDQAVEVSSLFLKEGTVVSTIARNKEQTDVRLVRPGIAFDSFPLVVLVNGSTASAAEIVAGAIQDHHRGLIVGAQTFGKGSVQSVIDLGSELGLKLTIARYFTPSGRSIQETGIEPDIELDEFDPALLQKAKINREMLRERDLKNHITHRDPKKSQRSALRKDPPKAKKRNADASLLALAFSVEDDPQVSEGLSLLKSFDVFQKMK